MKCLNEDCSNMANLVASATWDAISKRDELFFKYYVAHAELCWDGTVCDCPLEAIALEDEAITQIWERLSPLTQRVVCLRSGLIDGVEREPSEIARLLELSNREVNSILKRLPVQAWGAKEQIEKQRQQEAENKAHQDREEQSRLTPLSTLGLSSRATSALHRTGVYCVERIDASVIERLPEISCVGRKTIEEIRLAMNGSNLRCE